MGISNGLAGFSGALAAQSNNFVDIEMGARLVLLCITAIILGKLIIPQENIFYTCSNFWD